MGRRTEVEKADILGPTVVGAATESVSYIVEEIKNFNDQIRLNPDKDPRRFLIEIITFYVHLVDRLAFDILGVAGRQRFADRFMIAIEKFRSKPVRRKGYIAVNVTYLY